MTINVIHDIGPNLKNLGEKLVSLFSDLQAKLAELQAASATEHEQVMAALQALQDQLTASLTNSLTEAELNEINASFAAVKDTIGGIYTPPTP